MKYVSFTNENNPDKESGWCQIMDGDSPTASRSSFSEFQQGQYYKSRTKMGKFGLLMWKNWKLQIRHPIQTVMEILIPVAVCSLIVVIKNSIDTIAVPEKIYKPYAVHNTTTLSKYDEIVFSPNNSEVNLVMGRVKDDFPDLSFRLFDTASQLEQYLITANKISKIGIVFDDFVKNAVRLPSKLNIVIRFPSELHKPELITVPDWHTDVVYSLTRLTGPRDRNNNYNAEPEYFEEGFLTLQYSVTRSVIQYFKSDINLPNVMMERYPYSAFNDDPFIKILGTFISLFFVLGFMFTASSITKFVIVEKERQLKECMKIMGLPNSLHWSAWFAKSLIFSLITVVLILILFKVKFGSNGAVLLHSDLSVVFVFLLLYVCAIITFSFLISSLFNSANVATTVSALLFFLSHMPYAVMARSYTPQTVTTKLLASLCFNSAMAYGFEVICLFEGTEEGIGWNSLDRTPTPDYNLTMGQIFLMLIADSIIYMLLMLYIEAVFPGKYGVPKKWNFICSCVPAFKRRGIDIDVKEDVEQDPRTYEEEPDNLNAGIKIVHLKKDFSKTKNAVDDVSLNMFENQITVLLGHNGAGKTTTISMLTGMVPPTSGTAFINGYDIRYEITDVRSSIGLCPQHNILFDELTVAEHIYFFARLKGMAGDQLQNEIDYYISLLKLEDKRNTRAKALSGGMKRKLSVAMAFCGNAKVVLLDEPTAGMDPAARRALWEVVESQKRGRTILLTTHFMDEADLLGDRIAIMARGNLQCCGSSYFLKKKYGSGYHLIIEKTVNCDSNKVTELLRQYVADIQVSSDVGSELTYQLKESDVSLFYDMFSEIESNSEILGIISYGISLTTLEDVFLRDPVIRVWTYLVYYAILYHRKHVILSAMVRVQTKVGADTFEETANGTDSKTTLKFSLESATSSTATGYALWMIQIKAMFLKRALVTFRGWVMLFLQLLIPTLVLLILFLPETARSKSDLPKFPIAFYKYNKPVTLLSSSDPNNTYYRAAKGILNINDLSMDDIKDKEIVPYMLNLTKKDPSKFKMRYILGASFNENGIIAWFNNFPLHSPPLALSFIMNTILKTIGDGYDISVYNYPIPYTVKSRLKIVQLSSNMGNALASNIGFCFAFVAGCYVMFYIKERSCKVKHLQFVSGVRTLIFWGVSFIWDWIVYLMICTIIVVIIVCFQEDGFKTGPDMGRLLVILLYTGFSLLPVIYMLSFSFEVPSQGFVRVMVVMIVGVLSFIVHQVLSIESLSLTDVANVLDWPFLFLPLYPLADGIRWNHREFTRISFCTRLVTLCTHADIPGNTEAFCKSLVCGAVQECCKEAGYYEWERPGILRDIIFSILIGVVLWIFILLKEFKVVAALRYSFQGSSDQKEGSDAEVDSDVESEKIKVSQMSQSDINNQSLVLKNVTKRYAKHFVAVDSLYLAVNVYECFGLLGVNGAGKTTTFKMITGDTFITSGDIFVRGLNMKREVKEVNQLTGYCPQFDALFDELTVRETMKLFCLIKGYDSYDIARITKKLAADFDLRKHMDKKVKDLSGGNKRKLSTTVALVGDPPIIYLDEPTTGMDPASKRHLWNALCRVRDSGKCLVLTSHSMEECEALCTRLTIMVGGKLKCLGSLQHLKSKFSQGYTLTIKMKKLDPTEPTPDIESAILLYFPGAVLKEHHRELITFHLPGMSVPLSTIFKNMEIAKEALDMEDYSLTQSGLEQVFLSFTTTNPTEDS